MKFVVELILDLLCLLVGGMIALFGLLSLVILALYLPILIPLLLLWIFWRQAYVELETMLLFWLGKEERKTDDRESD